MVITELQIDFTSKRLTVRKKPDRNGPDIGIALAWLRLNIKYIFLQLLAIFPVRWSRN